MSDGAASYHCQGPKTTPSNAISNVEGSPPAVPRQTQFCASSKALFRPMVLILCITTSNVAIYCSGSSRLLRVLGCLFYSAKAVNNFCFSRPLSTSKSYANHKAVCLPAIASSQQKRLHSWLRSIWHRFTLFQSFHHYKTTTLAKKHSRVFSLM